MVTTDRSHWVQSNSLYGAPLRVSVCILPWRRVCLFRMDERAQHAQCTAGQHQRDDGAQHASDCCPVIAGSRHDEPQTDLATDSAESLRESQIAAQTGQKNATISRCDITSVSSRQSAPSRRLNTVRLKEFSGSLSRRGTRQDAVKAAPASSTGEPAKIETAFEPFGHSLLCFASPRLSRATYCDCAPVHAQFPRAYTVRH